MYKAYHFERRGQGDALSHKVTERVVFKSCYSMCGPRASSTGILWALTRNADPQPRPRPAGSEPAAGQGLQVVRWQVHVWEALAERSLWLWASEARESAQSMSANDLATLGGRFTARRPQFPPEWNEEIRMMLTFSALAKFLSFSECVPLLPSRSLCIRPNSLWGCIGGEGAWGADTLRAVEFLSLSFFFFGHNVRQVGSWFPDQGSNPRPLHWKRKVLTTGLSGKSCCGMSRMCSVLLTSCYRCPRSIPWQGTVLPSVCAYNVAPPPSAGRMLWAAPQVWWLICRPSSYYLWPGPLWAQWFQMQKGGCLCGYVETSLLMIHWLVHASIGCHGLSLPSWGRAHSSVAWVWSLESWRSNFGLAITCKPHFIALRRYCVFYKLKVCGNPATSKSVGAIFPTSFAHFMCLCHILVFLTVFQTFSLLLYLSWWSVISNGTIARRLQLTQGSSDG